MNRVSIPGGLGTSRLPAGYPQVGSLLDKDRVRPASERGAPQSIQESKTGRAPGDCYGVHEKIRAGGMFSGWNPCSTERKHVRRNGSMTPEYWYATNTPSERRALRV